MEQQNNNIQGDSLSQVFKVRGMKTDFSESSFENSFAFENKNMRINVVDDDNTLLNLTNERGTLYTEKKVSGIPIGVKKFDVSKALLFTTSNRGDFDMNTLKHNNFDAVTQKYAESANIQGFTDKICLVSDINDNIHVKELYSGNLGMCANNPLEIEHYKDGEKDFFYIVDGLNNLRTFVLENEEITVKNSNLYYNSEITGLESINAFEIQSNSGEFFSGVIVYCFAYITKQGHKTGIIDITNCKMISNYGRGRGLAPNTKSNIAYNITLSGLSSNFDKIEVYSLFRSSLDGEILVRKVNDVKIVKDTVSLSDYNTGEIWSYQELMSRFNSHFAPSTITQKDSTLFYGNIKTDNYENIKQLIPESANINLNTTEDYFSNNNIYYFGLQLQDRYGNWSPVIYINKAGNVTRADLPNSFSNLALMNGYVAARLMILDNKRIRRTVCEGIALPTISIDSAKYGIDYYSNYSAEINNYDIYNVSERIKYNFNKPYELYSPDIEFNEGLIINTDTEYSFGFVETSIESKFIRINTTINGNTAVLYNNNSDDLGSCYINEKDNKKYLIWKDAIEGYQKALQLLWSNIGNHNDKVGDNIVTSLLELSRLDFRENPTEYIIYTWQPNGSLNDSNGRTSVLNKKKLSFIYSASSRNIDNYPNKCKISFFDKTTNNIPIDRKVHAGIVNHDIYPSSWSISNVYRSSNRKDNGERFWDDNEIPYVENYSLAILETYRYTGQPIEIFTTKPDRFPDSNRIDKNIVPMWRYSAKTKSHFENHTFDTQNNICKGWNGTTLSYISNSVYSLDYDSEYQGFEKSGESVKVRVTNNFNRTGSIHIAYKSARHFVLNTNLISCKHAYVLLYDSNTQVPELSNSDIQNGAWIVCSSKVKLKDSNILSIDVDINDIYYWNRYVRDQENSYNCLKTEPYSSLDPNQVTCLIEVVGQKSYINPFCRYDNLVSNVDMNGITSDIFNKMNMVYNQKNNFFIFAGMTNETVADDSLSNTILYSDMKVINEKEDTFVNLNTTNFYTIDSNVTNINKLVVYNDKLICLSDNSVVQILYNENVVVNTDSVQSLGLASTDRVTGSQLISNTYGCINKWSVGIYNNILYFNDDLNNKIIAFTGEFSILNEELGIETINSRIFKRTQWNPFSWRNTKLNIDAYSKDVHYTTGELDIALNPSLGSFTSLYSYEKIPYMETINKHSVAFKYNKGFTEIHLMREGDYNVFFGEYKPYWTTIIMNQNSLDTKTLTNIEFNTEAYSENKPEHDFTFDTVTFWNDYQTNKMNVDYRMFGQSLLKKKFRVWRINRFRNESRMAKRNYDMISNPWSYLKLSSEKENTNKLTLHWIKLNYKNE